MPLARNLELERALVENPDDLERYAVYADWLQSQGDPRGELIALELRSERDGYRDDKLQILAYAVKRRVLGPAGLPFESPGTRRGFFDEARIAAGGYFGGFVAQLQPLLAHPMAIVLRAIRLRDEHGDGDPHEAIVAIGELAPPTVRELEVMVDTDLGDLSPIHRLPLRRLAFRQARLRRAVLHHQAVSSAAVRSIAAAPWPLEQLVLELGAGDATPSDLVAVLARDFPLVRLEIKRAADGSAASRALSREVCKAIVESPFAPRLEHLELALDLAQADYELLLANRSRFTALDKIDVPSTPYRRQLNGTRPRITR